MMIIRNTPHRDALPATSQNKKKAPRGRRRGGVGGDEAVRHPEAWRQCLVTRHAHPRSELIRFVVSPDGVLVPDLAEKLPGRGLWVTANAQTLKTALTRKLFARAARMPVRLPEGDLIVQISEMLVRRVREALGLAKRAGLVIPGIPNVRHAVSARRKTARLSDPAHDSAPPSQGVAMILISSDAGREAQTRALEATSSADLIVLRAPLTTDDMGAALGLSGISLVGFYPHTLTESLKNTVMRWYALQNNDSENKSESSVCTQVIPLREKDLIETHD